MSGLPVTLTTSCLEPVLLKPSVLHRIIPKIVPRLQHEPMVIDCDSDVEMEIDMNQSKAKNTRHEKDSLNQWPTLTVPYNIVNSWSAKPKDRPKEKSTQGKSRGGCWNNAKRDGKHINHSNHSMLFAESVGIGKIMLSPLCTAPPELPAELLQSFLNLHI
ncbi:hypothetical protein BT96DRAFT_937975 [Gymnopus androsaceus JB14]|uniref:Uncharacterized protein n=1 Tax=Gymnopus androsaceus JB14 TaxID=1447944 RepID=A0A6A4HSQ6_9AGAR|nr:hypothetical protein BT96DRAFT_937975 [Gymnopus androsaceus JB14]